MDGDLVLHHPRTNQVYLLNPTGAALWVLCDGVRTVETLARTLSEQHEQDHEQTLVDVCQLCNELQRAGLLLAH